MITNQPYLQRNLVTPLTVLVPIVVAFSTHQQASVPDRDRIKKGMTISEVESIFGMRGAEFPQLGVRSFAWRVRGGAIIAIVFDRKYRAEWIFVYSPEETWWQRISQLVRPR